MQVFVRFRRESTKNMFYLFTLFSVSLLCGYARSKSCYEPTGVDRMEYEAFFGVEPWYVVATTRNGPFPYLAPDGPGCPTAVLKKDVNDQVTYTYAWANYEQVWTGDIDNEKKKINLKWREYKGEYTVMEKGHIPDAVDGTDGTDYALVYFCTFKRWPPKRQQDNFMILTKNRMTDSTLDTLGKLELLMAEKQLELDITPEVQMERCVDVSSLQN